MLITIQFQNKKWQMEGDLHWSLSDLKSKIRQELSLQDFKLICNGGTYAYLCLRNASGDEGR